LLDLESLASMVRSAVVAVARLANASAVFMRKLLG
jgi:hypothetical protein